MRDPFGADQSYQKFAATQQWVRLRRTVTRHTYLSGKAQHDIADANNQPFFAAGRIGAGTLFYDLKTDPQGAGRSAVPLRASPGWTPCEAMSPSHKEHKHVSFKTLIRVGQGLLAAFTSGPQRQFADLCN
jgi:hypothetical protein